MTFETSDLNVVLSRMSNGKLFSINEEEQREALKGFYERLVSIIFLLVGIHDFFIVLGSMIFYWPVSIIF